MAERELLVRIVGDDRDLQRALKNTERSTARIDSRMQSVGKSVRGAFAVAGISLGTAAVFAGINKSVTAASDLNEQISRIRVILGDSANATIEWSRTTASAFGISQRAALSASATFAGLFQTVGVGQAEAGKLSQSLVQLAADLASLQNSSPEEALVALRSGLAGEAEPLRRFNIFLTEARVQQEALAETGKKTTSALTAQEKTLARYNLILRDSAPAQGNFADTSQGLANQQRILAAQVDDLSTQLGSVLVPTLTGVVGSMNDAATAASALFTAIGKLSDIPAIQIPVNFVFGGGRGAGLFRKFVLGTISPAALGLTLVKDLLDKGDKETSSITDKINASVQGPLQKLSEALEKRGKAIQKAADRDVQKQRDDFAAFVKGLGLKLDTAGLTTTVSDDIAVLRQLEGAILQQIEREGRTFKLAQQLVDVRRQIAGLIEQQAADAKQKSQDAFEAIVDSLSLDLEVAKTTKSLADDQKVLRKIEQAILARIKSEGRTTELLSRLLQVRQDQKEVASQIAQNARDRQQEKQFASLGLTEEGDKPTPGSGSLLKRAQSLQAQIKGTTLDTPKTRQQLARIISTLKRNFKTAGREVRAAILDMLNTISGSLDEKKGPLTATHGLSTNQIIKNLGLSVEQAEEIQRRLAHATTGGISRAVGGNRGTGAISPAERVFFESHTTINLDGVKVASVVTRQQQKAKRRNPKQKRGPNRR